MSSSTLLRIHFNIGMHASIATNPMPHEKPAAMPASTLPSFLQHHATWSALFGQIFFEMPCEIQRDTAVRYREIQIFFEMRPWT